MKGVILGSTIAEKILARASGQVRVNAGDNIQAKPDFVVAYDFPGYTDVIFKQMKDEFGLTGVKDPSRYALFIDHIDRNKLNNHPDNLRLVTVRLNGLNRKMNSNNTSGANGVRFLKGKWYSRGVFHRKFVHLGCFDSKQEAITARQAWEQEQWAA